MEQKVTLARSNKESQQAWEQQGIKHKELLTYVALKTSAEDAVEIAFRNAIMAIGSLPEVQELVARAERYNALPAVKADGKLAMVNLAEAVDSALAKIAEAGLFRSVDSQNEVKRTSSGLTFLEPEGADTPVKAGILPAGF